VNFSLLLGTWMTWRLEIHVELGEIPRRRAVARTNGLKAEPGWRWPCVARLNGTWS
jgi:hypothetical protein